MTALPLLQDKNGKRGNNGTANGINAWGEAAGVSENPTADTICPAYDPSLGQSQYFQQKPVVWQFGRRVPHISILRCGIRCSSRARLGFPSRASDNVYPSLVLAENFPQIAIIKTEDQEGPARRAGPSHFGPS